jgi:hypothetical protein
MYDKFVTRAASPIASIDRFFELALLGLAASGFLALAGSGFLDTPTMAVTAAGLLLRALQASGLARFEIGTRLFAVLVGAPIALLPVDYLLVSRDFLPATVHLLFLLAVVKVLTARGTRDHVLIAAMAVSALLAAAVLSMDLSFFVFLALFLIFGVATFTSAEIRRSVHKPRQVARGALRSFNRRLAALTLSVAIGILALTAGMFFLLPRTAAAAFERLMPQRFRMPGFASEVVLGETGDLRQSRTAMMHVRFFDAGDPPVLKWRGAALSDFDGRRWTAPDEIGRTLLVDRQQHMVTLFESRPEDSQVKGLGYEVQLNSTASDVLFFAGSPRRLLIDAPAVIRTPEDEFKLPQPAPAGLHYGVYAMIEDAAAPVLSGPPLGDAERQRYLALPRLDQRIAALAREITDSRTTDRARAQALESYLRTHYGYSTKLLDAPVEDPLAYFLFNRRQGHCEYFASAMAVMLRAIGIPSRVATGFQSGVYNPVSGWWVIRASDAHSWVEAWLPGRGWTTFDATPPGADASRSSWWSRIGFYLDAADTFWQEWVLNYNLDRQRTLASQMHDSGRSFGAEWLEWARAAAARARAAATAGARRYGAAALVALLGIAALLLAAPRGWRWVKARRRILIAQRGAAEASDATLLYERMLRLLKRRGYEKPAWVTPAEFARMLPQSGMASSVERFTGAYNELRFGGNAAAAQDMLALLEQLERA